MSQPSLYRMQDATVDEEIHLNCDESTTTKSSAAASAAAASADAASGAAAIADFAAMSLLGHCQTSQATSCVFSDTAFSHECLGHNRACRATIEVFG